MASRESDIIKNINEIVKSNRFNEGTVVSIGDDTALVDTGSKLSLITTDAMVEGTHFIMDKIPPKDIGWKCAISNVSDIAAMGGTPQYAVTTIGISEKTSDEWIQSLYQGIEEGLKTYGAYIVGGDTVKSPITFINITLTGIPYYDEKSNPKWLARNSGKSGDLVVVTGSLGGSSLGLSLVEDDPSIRNQNPGWNRHIHPEANIKTAQLALSCGVRTGMDISDGLIVDLEKIALASEHDIEVKLSDVPIFEDLEKQFGLQTAQDMALTSGEEYELILIADKQKFNDLLKQKVKGLSVIGQVLKSNPIEPSVTVVTDKGSVYLPSKSSWQHFEE